jgi:hypothetical protein
MDLEQAVKLLVNNLHQSYLSQYISEWNQKDAFQLREELAKSSITEGSSNSSLLFEKVRRYIFSKTFEDEELVDFLSSVPKWAGFQIDTAGFETGAHAIEAARHSAISTLWLMSLPRSLISHVTSPQEFENQGVDTIVTSLLKSDSSRSELNDVLSRELSNRGLDIGHFSMDGVVKGYLIKESSRDQRLRDCISLILMRATELPFDLDSIFNLSADDLIEETTAYIICMHTRKMLSDRISGSRSSKPFDWPLIGTVRVFTDLISTLDILMKFASKLTTCPMFTTTNRNSRVPWTKEEFMSFLIKEIIENYSNTLRSSSGKSKNMELAQFVAILKGENIDITSRVLESDDRPESLYEEFSECKRRARVGEKPQISPERRFRVILSTLKQRLSQARIEKISSDEIIEQISDAFEAMEEIIQKHENSLGHESDKFTEELCFETSFRILELLDLGGTVGDLPWVSRFVAEESVRSGISDGDITDLEEEHRIRRIISAYAGGVVYLVLQAWD